ncbi:hypothetical protein CBR_g31884 [Chara braunii]|uniref:Aldehyde dehydrogenase domain-containing protein n=1 Tax=Chara braunii TaxID=69332 RepID=A0A388LGA2_CHABU|nr:hypothetical protein CBR_g31884 [Chara braunii]|eukprot:GBG81212.1 hypothetical protein CBR_g31884 [Chara braunii]
MVLLCRFNLLTENAQDLAKLMTLENGKPLNESMIEVTYGSSFVEWFAEEAKRVYGDIIPATVADRKILVVKQVSPALAVGCTVVLKPSELTPLTALAAAELALRAGLPPGVLNMVFGDAPAVGKAILESNQVRKITFTGSTAVGKLLMRGSADTVKKISLELGGNAPCIIFDDADVDVAVRGTVCIYDEFSKKLAEAVAKLKVGNGFDEGVSIGPLINENGLSKVRGARALPMHVVGLKVLKF